MTRRRCTACNLPIPPERLAALPDTESCVGCSRVRPVTERDLDIDGTDPLDMIKAVSNQGD